MEQFAPMDLQGEINFYKDKLTKVINHNNGWFVVGNKSNFYTIGKSYYYLESIFGKEIPFTVIGEATEAEAKADCDFLGLPMTFNAGTWVKAICD